VSPAAGRITRDLEKFLMSTQTISASNLEAMAVLRAIARVLADELDNLDCRLRVLEEKKPK